MQPEGDSNNKQGKSKSWKHQSHERVQSLVKMRNM